MVNKSKGLTLVEMLVATTVFVLVVGTILGVFVSSIRAQARILDSQRLFNETSYVIEYMSRALRMAKKDLSGDCLGLPKHNYMAEESKIRFLNYDNYCQEFFLSDSRLYERKSTDHSYQNFGDPVFLSSSNIIIESFQFGPSETWGQGIGEQPRVTLSFDLKTPREEIKINAQTTISQRRLNVEE